MNDIKVIHLELKDSHQHYYYGSLKAFTEEFGKDIIGIGYSALRNATPTEDKPFENGKCIIRRGVLKQVSTNRGKKSEG